ncbi:MAG TPA: parallel beta-helix domain-containing protein [Vicinamibacteria bacterium]|nr:parallel beta-helix domain-containing protein [Vicinamibacteria bacterium]
MRAVAGAACLLLLACRRPAPPPPGAFQAQLQERLIKAASGETIEIPAGRFEMTRTLTLTGKTGVTLRGAGMDRTILSFAGQASGAEGVKVEADAVTIEGLTIQDARGDALKVERSDGVTIRDVKAEWTRGPHRDNGAYGLYPVQCSDVLIEGSVSIGASDAGIYVGQSSRVVVRRSRAERNVAGFELENTRSAELHDNVAVGNTGGILVFDLPDLPVQGGRDIRVHRNTVRDNNEPNFAPSGNIVAKVPTGTGVMIMANDAVEVFDNTIEDHRTMNLAVVSYYVTEERIKDARYDPLPEAVYVHDNRFARGGYDPVGGAALQSKKVILALRLKLGTPFPDLLWDGVVRDGLTARDARICFRRNGAAAFANLDAAHDFRNVSRELSPHDCALDPVPAVALASAAVP